MIYGTLYERLEIPGGSPVVHLDQCFPNCVPLKKLKCVAKILCFDEIFCEKWVFARFVKSRFSIS